MPASRVNFFEVFGPDVFPAARGKSHLENGLIQEQEAMSLFRKVVVPIGLVSDPEPILSQVAGLAARFHSEILLLQLYPHTCKQLHEPGEVAHLRSRLSKTARQFVNAGIPRVYAALLEGNASFHIEEAARQHHASLILISEEQRDDDAQPWFGTITQRLSRHAHVPLLVMKPGASLAMSPVMCAVDFSEPSRIAVGHALELTRALAAQLLIQHVVPEPCIELNEGPLWKAEPSPVFLPEHLDMQRMSPVKKAEVERKIRAAQEELQRSTAEFDLSGVEHEMQVVCGSLVAETIFTARAKRAGVVVMGSSRSSGFAMVESQTPAEAVAEIADIPVLISHAPVPARPQPRNIPVFKQKPR